MENQPITLWDRFTTCLSSKYCCFEGRATRAEYWGYVLFNFLVIGIPVGILAGILSVENPQSLVPGLLNHLLACVLLLPGLGVSVRRMHDTGRSGWILLLALIPLVGAIILLVFSCQDSWRGTNKYGPSEKYPEDTPGHGDTAALQVSTFSAPTTSSLVMCVLSMVTYLIPLVGLIVVIIALATTPKDARHKVPRILDWISFALAALMSGVALIGFIAMAGR